MPDAMDPSFIICHRHQMHAYSLEISHTFLCLSRGIPPSLGSEVLLCVPFPRTTRFINLVPIQRPLSISSYPTRRYDEYPDERMTTRRDALMQSNEDINEKDQLLREGQQGQEDSLEYETETLPLPLPF